MIPFEQLASGSSRGFAPRGRGGPPRRGRGRAPGAFSAAAEEEDLSREFDFAGMNARFADLRTGEKGEGEGDAEAGGDDKKEDEPKEEEKKPAYNKKSSFFDSVSSNIQNPGRGRGRPQQYNHRNDGRQHQQYQREPFQHEQRQDTASNYTSGPPRFSQGPPRQNNHRYTRRDESALNDLTFGDGSDPAPRRGRGRGNGRRRGSDVQQRVFEQQQ